MTRNVPVINLRAGYQLQRSEIDAAVARVLDSGWYILGKEVEAFETDFAAWVGAEHAVGVANGTDAIAIALRVLGVGDGDLVFTVSHTAVATVAAIELVGAEPVFVDIDPRTYTIDPEKLEDAIRETTASGKTARAVVAVHLYGHPCAVSDIRNICAHHGLFLIEDCAQAHGAAFAGGNVGTFGDIATFSFYPTKNLGAFGDGGAIVTSDASLGDKCKALRQYGWYERYLSDVAGTNSRLDELQAAILSVRLRNLSSEIAARRKTAAGYGAALSEHVCTPYVAVGCMHAYHLYVIRSDNRDGLMSRLKAAGVGTAVHYPVPVHLQRAYRGRLRAGKAGLVETERAAREVLSLPMHPFLDEADIEHVVRSIRDAT